MKTNTYPVPSTYSTLHLTVARRPDGSYAVSLVQKRWRTGAKDSGRVLHRGTIKPEAQPGGFDSDLWAMGVYLQQLAARGVVTSIGVEPTEEAPREPRGAVGGGASS